MKRSLILLSLFSLLAFGALLSQARAFEFSSVAGGGSIVASWTADDCDNTFTSWYGFSGDPNDLNVPIQIDSNPCTGATPASVSLDAQFGGNPGDFDAFVLNNFPNCGTGDICEIYAIPTLTDCEDLSYADCLATAISSDFFYFPETPGMVVIPPTFFSQLTATVNDSLNDPGTQFLIVLAIGIPLLFYIIMSVLEASPGRLVGGGFNSRGKRFRVYQKLGIRYRDDRGWRAIDKDI